MSTKKLQIITPIVTSVNGGTGDITMNSIEYTPQSLTDAQKSQARDNIGAQEMYSGLTPIKLYANKLIGSGTQEFTIYLSDGSITQYADNASDDVKGGFQILQRYLDFGMSRASVNNKVFQNEAKKIWAIYNAGLMTVPFVAYGDYKETHLNKMQCYADATSFEVRIRYNNDAYSDYVYDFANNKFTVNTFNGPPLYTKTNDASTAAQALSQLEMSAAPTTDMQIATKKYVDDGIAGKADSSHNHSASDITSGTLPITRGGTDASTAAAARTNLGFSYGTSVPTSAPVTGNGAVFFCQDSGSPLSIANGGTGGATQDAARTNLGLPTQDKRLLTICSGTRLVSGSNITITLDPTEAKKYSSILIMLGTPLGGNYGNMYDSFVFPLNPDTWSFRFFKYTLEGQDWQCAKANLSSDWTTFTITAASGNTNHPCWCYLM